MSKQTRIIINRQKASYNRKQKDKLPNERNMEEATISVHNGNDVDYGYGVTLKGEWKIVQDYANSPCSGAHIWLEGMDGASYEITHRKPRSEWDGTSVPNNENAEGVPETEGSSNEGDDDFDFSML